MHVILPLAYRLTQSSRGSIQFSPLPPLPTPVSVPEKSSYGLGGYSSLASGLVDTVRPGRLPRSAIAEVIAIENEQLNLGWGIPQPEADTFLTWLAPAIATVALGLLLAVVLPITGCCIFCCRNSGHCGAKSRIYRKKHHNIKCFIYTSFFLLSNAMILVGAILGLVSVKHLSTNLRQLDSTVDTTLSDISNYLDGSTKQVGFIADDQFGVLETHVLDDLEYIGEWFEGEISGDIQSDANEVVSHAEVFLNILLAIDNLTTGGNVLIRDLRTLTSDLVLRISTLNENLTALNDLCHCSLTNSSFCITNSSVCNFPTDFAVMVNYTDIGNVDFNDQIDFNKTEEQIKNTTDTFQDLAHFIDMEAENYQLSDRAESEFQKAHDTIQDDYLDTINKTLSDITSDDGIISEVHDALKFLDTYERYWFGVALVLVSTVFLIVALFIVGSFCGGFGYSPVARPHSRSSVSHCGGILILLGVVVAFVSSPLLLVVTSASYGLATGVQKVCNDLQPPDYLVFREVADNPSFWGGVTLVGVITRETVATTINLSIAQTLSGCAQNEAIWKVLDGDNVYSLDFDDAFNCSSFGVGSDDFVPFDGFNHEDIFPSLDDVADFYDTDFDEYKNLTNDTILSFNLTELKTNLTMLQGDFANMSNDTVYLLTTKILSDIDTIEILLSDLQSLQVYVEGNVTEIQMTINSNRSEFTDFRDLLDAFLEELSTVVSNATDYYINRLCSFVDDYINYAQDTIKNDLGRCHVLPVAYSALYSRACENALDGLNGYWLSMGWCMLFSVAAVVLGLVLSDYFRRASTRVVKCTDTTAISSENTSLIPYDDDENVSIIQMSHNQHTAAPHANSLPEERQPLHTTQMDLEW